MLDLIFSPYGRIKRMQFFWGNVILLILGMILGFILLMVYVHSISEEMIDPQKGFSLNVLLQHLINKQMWLELLLSGVAILALMWFQICLVCKRLRDIGWSIWLILVYFVPHSVELLMELNQQQLLAVSAAQVSMLLLLLVWPSSTEE